VDSKSGPGRKGFTAQLTLSQHTFKLDADGFGLFAKNINYYAATSVMLLFQYFGRKRLKDGDYLYSLCEVAKMCGTVYLNANLTKENHVGMVVKIIETAQLATPLYGPSWVKHPDAVYGDRVEYLATVRVPEALYQVGGRYFKGEGRDQDYKAAAHYFRKAAEEGFTPAKYMLGKMLFFGEGVYDGVKQSFGESIKWITEAAVEGSAAAQIMLGYMYYAGSGVPQNLKEAKKWYSMAAEQGDEEAQKKLKEIAD
jgi:TPR repeat protein